MDFSTFAQIDVRVGRVISVEEADGCRVPACKVLVDFGAQIGTKQSIAQITHYDAEQLCGRQILAVVNLGPKQVGQHRSEVLILGVPTENRETALVVPDMEAVIGGRLF